MEFSFELWINRGLLGPFQFKCARVLNPSMRRRSLLFNLCTPF